MVPDGLFWSVAIRAGILFFRSITPLCLVHSVLFLAGYAPVFTIHGYRLRFEIITIPESLFYLVFYIPKSRSLQKPALEGTQLTRQERRDLFEKFWSSVPDIDYFLSTWFRGAPADQVKRDDIKLWLEWAFFNRFSIVADDELELDEYVNTIEERFGKRFEEASGSHLPVRPTVDHINIQHRPLSYYICGVGLMDSMVFLKMWRLGFSHYALRRWFQSFPYRPLSTVCKHYSLARDVSYWYRPHTSRTRLPILYIHGIGVGLVTYTDFFAALIEKDESTPDDQVGILAIEVMPISFRITSPILHSQEMVRQIGQILTQQGWDNRKLVIAANSYGTIIAAHLCHSPVLSQNIGPMVLIDPVTVWIHMGDVAYNFTAKKPKTASEHQLHYFACTDMMAAHTVTRRFVWTENMLWKEEYEGKKVGMVVSGRDIILNGPRLLQYLIADQPEIERSSIGALNGAERIKCGELEVLWFKNLNHAEVFENQKEMKALVDMVWEFCCET